MGFFQVPDARKHNAIMREVSISEKDVQSVENLVGSRRHHQGIGSYHAAEDAAGDSRKRPGSRVADGLSKRARQLLNSCARLPETAPDLGTDASDTSRVVTLRIRMKQKVLHRDSDEKACASLPDFCEGDIIVGINEDFDKYTDDSPGSTYHTGVFRVISVVWGVNAYVNMLVDSASQEKSTGTGCMAKSDADKNCFAVCRIVRLGSKP